MSKLINLQKHTNQRLRLLTHARRLIANQGFKETSMAQIAKACKVTKATLYHYFKSKEDILLAILGCHQDEMDYLKGELTQTQNLEEVFYAIARNQLEKMGRSENLDFLKILVNEAMTNPEVKKFYMAFIKESITSISRDILTPHIEAKMSEVEIRRICFQFVAALAHYIWQVKMVGALSDIIGDDDAYIRLLARVYASQFKNLVG